jgi:hypothetical protein
VCSSGHRWCSQVTGGLVAHYSGLISLVVEPCYNMKVTKAW